MKRDVVGDRGVHFLRALQGTDITVFYQDLNLKYIWIENPPEGWIIEEIIGQDDSMVLPAAAANEAVVAKRRAISDQTNQRLELKVSLTEGHRWFDIWIDPDFDVAGNVQGLLCFSVEITEKKKKEVNLHELLLEISHRSRNLLAIVQGLATQTLKTSNNHQELDHFNSRLQSLASSLDLVTKDSWDGAQFRDLVSSQIAPYVFADNSLVAEGQDPKLSPNAAIHVGLAIQELASSSVRTSGIKLNSERVHIHIGTDDGSILFQWKEHRPEAQSAQNAHNLDETILLKIAPRSVSGTADIVFEGGQLVYRLTIPQNDLL